MCQPVVHPDIPPLQHFHISYQHSQQPANHSQPLQHQQSQPGHRPHIQMGHQPFQGPLINDKLSLLQKGPNFAITPKYPPLNAYITATEVAAAKLNTQEAEEFRSDVSRLLKQHQHQTNATSTQHSVEPSPNLNRTTPGSFSQQTRGWLW